MKRKLTRSKTFELYAMIGFDDEGREYIRSDRLYCALEADAYIDAAKGHQIHVAKRLVKVPVNVAAKG